MAAEQNNDAALVENYSPEDRAFYDFWYGHMWKDQLPVPLDGLAYSTARYIWDAARRTPSASIGEDGLPKLQEPFGYYVVESNDVPYPGSGFVKKPVDGIKYASITPLYAAPPLSSEQQAAPVCRNCLGFGWAPTIDGPRRPCSFCQKPASEQQANLPESPDSSAGTAQKERHETDQDPLYDKAVMIVRAHNRASISLVQRMLMIGYNRAMRLMSAMEKAWVVSVEDQNGCRTVVASVPQAEKGENA